MEMKTRDGKGGNGITNLKIEKIAYSLHFLDLQVFWPEGYGNENRS